MLKRPQQELWAIMRDHLVDFAGDIADIEEIRQIERTAGADGIVDIVNEWRMRQQIPAAIRAMLNIGELGWIDRNTWNAATATCSWTIEPSFLGDYVTCSGETTFTSAMAGQGTRVRLPASSMSNQVCSALWAIIAPMVSGFVESIVTTIIPRNLRAVVEAAAAFELPCDSG